MSVTYARNWLSMLWDGTTVEKFKEVLAEGRPSEVDAEGWEEMKRKCLFDALFDNKIVLVSLLIEQQGFDVNACMFCDRRGHKTGGEVKMCKADFSPIYIPIINPVNKMSNVRLKILEKLLAIPGCDVNARGTNGTTALMMAIRYGQIDIIRLLAKVDGLDLDAVDDNNDSSTILAMKLLRGAKQSEVLKILKDARVAKESESMEKEKEGVLQVSQGSGLGKARNARKSKQKERRKSSAAVHKVDNTTSGDGEIERESGDKEISRDPENVKQMENESKSMEKEKERVLQVSQGSGLGKGRNARKRKQKEKSKSSAVVHQVDDTKIGYGDT